MAFTNAGEILALETVLTSTYIALFQSAPNESGSGGVEVTGDGYGRLAWAVNFTGGNPTTATNTAPVTFSAAGSWGTVSHMVIMTAAIGGTVMAVLELVDPNDLGSPLPKTISSGDDLTFAIGEIVITLE